MGKILHSSGLKITRFGKGQINRTPRKHISRMNIKVNRQNNRANRMLLLKESKLLAKDVYSKMLKDYGQKYTDIIGNLTLIITRNFNKKYLEDPIIKQILTEKSWKFRFENSGDKLSRELYIEFEKEIFKQLTNIKNEIMDIWNKEILRAGMSREEKAVFHKMFSDLFEKFSKQHEQIQNSKMVDLSNYSRIDYRTSENLKHIKQKF